jgi:hypothetical protein
MRFRRESNPESGTALTMCLLTLVALCSISTAMVLTSTKAKEECAVVQDELRRRCLAESGLARAILDLHAGGTGSVGSATAPVAFGEGSFWVSAVKQTESIYLVTSHGIVGNGGRAIRAVLEKKRGVFHHAMFIGNSSGDPSYTFRLGGMGEAGDLVTGDLYSGGNVSIEGDSRVTGTVRATGTIQGATGETGYTQPPPDLRSMNYPVNNDVDVAAEFAAHGIYKSMTNAGTAYQVPQDKLSHIFRLNPSDRSSNTKSTVKNDWFLEDPYEPWVAKSTLNFASATKITLAGTNTKPGPNGNHLVYYLDGNLWIHTLAAYSLGIDHTEPEGVQITIVARGNIYFSDNFFYKSTVKDAVAFIAIKDPAVADSGNIYFGDPTYGTLAHMEGYLYAENNFYDMNLDELGSTSIDVLGIMSAGNQVRISRDSSSKWLKTTHTRLAVALDDRVMKGQVTLPGLPFLEAGTQSDTSYVVLSMMPVADGN